jgi:hypothetical protein
VAVTAGGTGGGRNPSFRGDAKHRARNLEIPGLVLTHHPGMTVYISLYDSAGRALGRGPCFGPHRVRTTLRQDSRPSSIIDAAVSTK